MHLSARKAAPHILNPTFWRGLVAWKPFSVTSFVVCERLLATIGPIDNIFDFGANIGQFSRAALELLSPTLLVGVEPNPAAADKYRKNLPDSVHVERCAVGDKRTTAVLNISRNSTSSSLLQPDSDLSPLEVVDHVETPVRTIDDIVSSHRLAEGSTLVKLDIQGFELDALRGATQTLQTADYLLLELSLRASYVGEPLADDVLNFLRAKSQFTIADVVDTLRTPEGRPWQLDLLLERRKAAA